VPPYGEHRGDGTSLFSQYTGPGSRATAPGPRYLRARGFSDREMRRSRRGQAPPGAARGEERATSAHAGDEGTGVERPCAARAEWPTSLSSGHVARTRRWPRQSPGGQRWISTASISQATIPRRSCWSYTIDQLEFNDAWLVKTRRTAWETYDAEKEPAEERDHCQASDAPGGARVAVCACAIASVSRVQRHRTDPKRQLSVDALARERDHEAP
jgi:hypothetical protein